MKRVLLALALFAVGIPFPLAAQEDAKTYCKELAAETEVPQEEMADFMKTCMEQAQEDADTGMSAEEDAGSGEEPME